MRAIVAFLPAAVCLGMMLICGRMLFGKHDTHTTDTDEIAALRAEVENLRQAQRSLDAAAAGQGKGPAS